MNYNELSKQIHSAQVAKGFYEHKPSDNEKVVLIISELYEMLDANRKGKMLKDEHLQLFLGLESFGEFDCQIFEKTCKSAFEFEFTDVFIRFLDFAGFKGYEFEEEFPMPKVGTLIGNFFSDVMELNEKFLWFNYKAASIDNEYHFEYCLRLLLQFAKKYSIDLETLIPIKLKYSLTLPYKHGKRY